MIARLVTVLSGEVALRYLEYQNGADRPINQSSVESHVRLFGRHANPDDVADRMIVGGWKNPPTPEKLDAGIPRATSAPKRMKRSKGRKRAQDAKVVRKRSKRRENSVLRPTKLQGRERLRDLAASAAIKLRDQRRQSSHYPASLLDTIPDAPLEDLTKIGQLR
ncbi:MAG: hypothetical protein WDZ83_02275 [Rhizobiaceae bacterium]